MTAGARVLIGGLGYRFHRDGSFGLLAGDALERLVWPERVRVDDLGYGAILVAHDLAAAVPAYRRLVLLTASVREREPGHLYARRWRGGGGSDEEVQARVREAGAGVIDVDHLLVVAEALGALPPEVYVLELEPVELEGGEGLSERAEALLPEAIAWARKVALAPLTGGLGLEAPTGADGAGPAPSLSVPKGGTRS